MLADNLASRRTRYIHSHVTPADDDDFFSDRELISEIYVEQEINALINAIQINSGDGEVAAAVCAHRDQHCVESLVAQIGNCEVSSGRLIKFQSDVTGR